MSPVLFIIYLAKALKGTEKIYSQQNLSDHNYYKIITPTIFTLDQQYADDIGYATTSEEYKRRIKKKVPPKITGKNLNINDPKTEDYHYLATEGSEEWQNANTYADTYTQNQTSVNGKYELSSPSTT